MARSTALGSQPGSVSKELRDVLENPRNLAKRRVRADKIAGQIEERSSKKGQPASELVVSSNEKAFDASRSLAKVENKAPVAPARSQEAILRNAYLKLNTTTSQALRDTGAQYDALASEKEALQSKWNEEKAQLATLQIERQQIAQQKWKPGKAIVLRRLDRDISASTLRCLALESDLQKVRDQVKRLESNSDLMDVFEASQILAIRSNPSGKAFLKGQAQTFADAVTLLEDDDLVLKNWANEKDPDQEALTLDKAGEAYDQLLARKREYYKIQESLQDSLVSAESIDLEGAPALFTRRFKQDQREAVLSTQQSLLAVQEKLKSVEKKMSVLRAANPELDQLLSTWDFLGKDQIFYGQIQVKTEAASLVRESSLVQNQSDVLVVGDSVAYGLRNSLGSGIGFVGRSGLSSGEILKKAKENPDAFKNRKMVIINAGGNDVSWNNTDKIVANIDAIVAMARKAGVPKIVVLTRIPYEHAYGENKVTQNMPKLAEALRKKFGKESGVQLVDLNQHLADAEGRLPERYANAAKTTDKLHPYRAYGAALKFVSKEAGEPIIAEWLKSSKRQSSIG